MKKILKILSSLCFSLYKYLDLTELLLKKKMQLYKHVIDPSLIHHQTNYNKKATNPPQTPQKSQASKCQKVIN